MGLSTKQVSSDGFDWGQRLLQSSGGLELSKPPPPAARRQHQQQQSEPLPCPRCGSTNTKFCYYNNYNKSQPRHFCKACKRHWTKGGTLRNVPVGGGRKNKRPKTAAVSSARSNTHIGITIQREQVGDQKKASSESSLYQALIPRLSSSSQLESIIINTGNFNAKGLSRANSGDFLASSPPNLLRQNQTRVPFTFSTLSSFESNPFSMSASFGSSLSNAYNFTEGFLGSVEEATTTTIMPTAISIVSQPWEEVPTTSSDVMDMANYWNWDDINTLIPTDQLNMHWDDTEIKPQ